jgi:hypothetical protein
LLEPLQNVISENQALARQSNLLKKVFPAIESEAVNSAKPTVLGHLLDNRDFGDFVGVEEAEQTQFVWPPRIDVMAESKGSGSTNDFPKILGQAIDP